MLTILNKRSIFFFIAAGFAVLSFLIGLFAEEELSIEQLNLPVTQSITTGLSSIDRQMDNMERYLADSSLASLTTSKENYLFVFERGVLKFWSNNDFVPRYSNINGDYNLKFYETREGEFLMLHRKVKVNAKHYEFIGLLPLIRKYEVTNAYLVSGVRLSGLENLQIEFFDSEHDEGHLVTYKEYPALKFKVYENYVFQNNALGWLVFVLFWSSVLFFIRFLYLVRFSENTRHGFKLNFLVYTLFFFVLRFFTNYFNFPVEYIESIYFAPNLYASSFYNPSLGDFLINAILILILGVYFFRYYNYSGFYNWALQSKQSIKWIIGVLLSTCSYFLLDGFYEGFNNLYIHSQISLDITKTINFSEGRIMGSVILIVIGLLFFLFSDVVYKLLYKLNQGKIRMLWYNLLAGGVCYIAIKFHFSPRIGLIALSIVGYYALLTFTKIPLHLGKMANPSIFYILACILTLSFVGAMAIKDNEEIRSIKQKARFAQEHLYDNDVLGEFLLNRVKKDIKEDLFIKSRLSNPFLSKDEIEERVIRTHLPEYFNKYDIHVNVYNPKGDVIYGDGKFKIVNESPNTFNGSKYKTDYSDLFFVDAIGNEPTKRYVQVIRIENRHLMLGYLAIDMVLKKIIPENVLPKLLMDSRYVIPLSDEIFSYTVLNRGIFQHTHGEFNYEKNFDLSLLDKEQLYSAGVVRDGFTHFALKGADEKVYILTSATYKWSHVVTNFSSIFLQIFIMIVFLALCYALYFGISGKNLNYSARIQLYLNIAFFLPLIVLSISTISLLTSSFEEEVNMEYFKKANAISENVNITLDEYWSDKNETKLKVGLSELSRHTHADANLYNPDGRLIASSQPEIFSRGLSSKLINPEVYDNIVVKGKNKVVSKEQIGNAAYFATYLSIRSFETGNLTGILGVPYFESEEAQGERAIEVINYIINMFVVIFLVFLAISYFVSKWITFPLKFMANALNRTTFSEKNEPIMWESEDEIGLMVSEYNKMVGKLEESKEALARSEKESAWREIAQQVAHEIKNPLTPMKLTLQHLQMTIKNEESLENRLQKPINTLLFQIESLNDIATSFSSFAKMPLPVNKRFEIASIVRKACELHMQVEHGAMQYTIENDPVYVIGDESLLSRIVSNIIINAEQARKPNVPLELEVILKKVGNKVRVEVKDNGRGIPEALHGKIFIPNFSTKSSGSGIGLAIAKHGVESAGGNIWFETELDIGTTFFIELPCDE